MERVYFMHNRGSQYLYHFIVFQLGGLYYILNNLKLQIGKDTLEKCEFKTLNNLTETQKKNINYQIKPIKILFSGNILDFHKEAFEILNEDIQLITINDIKENYYFEESYGVTLTNNLLGDELQQILPFLRNLFLSKLHFNFEKNKKIFITRKKSENQHNGILKRYILNEEELMEKVLKKYNFEFIQLENYNFKEKIMLFNTSSIILSSHSGSLTFSIFANKNTKIIEILNKGTSGFVHGHYQNITNILGLNYFKYANIKEDSNGNFNININDFDNYLKNIINV